MSIPSIDDFSENDYIQSMEITKKARIYFDNLVFSVFNNPKGQELLDLLKQYYLDKPVAHYSWGPNITYYREGQNSLIRDELISAFKRSKDGVNHGLSE